MKVVLVETGEQYKFKNEIAAEEAIQYFRLNGKAEFKKKFKNKRINNEL